MNTTNTHILFDVDGTLTYPRTVMTAEHCSEFLSLMNGKKFSFVSGSDYKKLQEQLPKNVLHAATNIFCSMGNVQYQKDNLVYKSQSNISNPFLIDILNHLVETSKFPLRTGNHIEIREGMINLSTVGRNSTKDQREEYFKWDLQHREREAIVKQLKQTFEDYDFLIGGMISIDIVGKGCSKSQVLDRIQEKNIVFFGDRIIPGGNDYELAQAIMSKCLTFSIHNVHGPEQTLYILNKSFKEN